MWVVRRQNASRRSTSAVFALLINNRKERSIYGTSFLRALLAAVVVVNLTVLLGIL
jgi:hypothetical protein